MANLGRGGRSWLSYTWRRQIRAQRRQREKQTCDDLETVVIELETNDDKA